MFECNHGVCRVDTYYDIEGNNKCPGCGEVGESKNNDQLNPHVFEYETECGHKWKYSENVASMSFTTDCKECSQLLVMVGGGLLLAHKHWNSQNQIWPAEGSNTGYLEI